MKNAEIMLPLFDLETDGMNLVSYLAFKGLDTGVDQLIAEGATLADAIYGYARAGNQEKANVLLKNGSDSMSDACVGSAIRGYARGEFMEMIHDIPEYKNHMGDLLFGLAQAGKTAMVSSLLGRNLDLFNSAVEGYATCNHADALVDLIKGTVFFPSAIYYAARSGQTELVNVLLEYCDADADMGESPLNKALEGYMSGRHFQEAAELISRGASLSQSVMDLKNAQGFPDRDLYLAFLAHIPQADLRQEAINIINRQGELIDSIIITEKDIPEISNVTLPFLVNLVSDGMTSHDINLSNLNTP